jgi:hypothetical protein
MIFHRLKVALTSLLREKRLREQTSTSPPRLALDAVQIAWLFINWTVADWLLTLLAAGTAIPGFLNFALIIEALR